MTDPWEDEVSEASQEPQEGDTATEKVRKAVGGEVVDVEGLEGFMDVLPAICNGVNATWDAVKKQQAQLEELERQVARVIKGLTILHQKAQSAPAPAPSPRPSGPPAGRQGGYGGGGGGGGRRPMTDEQKLAMVRRDVAGYVTPPQDMFSEHHLHSPIPFGKQWKGTPYSQMLQTVDGASFLSWVVGKAVEELGPDPAYWQRKDVAQIALWALKWHWPQGQRVENEPDGGAEAPF